MSITNPFVALATAISAMRRRPTAWGRDESCRLPLALVARIVEEIDADGIHPSDGTRLVLDGSHLADLADRGIPELTWLQRRALRRAGWVGTESAAMTFRGDVVVTDCPEQLVARARDRGAKTGFAHSDLILSMAATAATASGRPMSGATPR